VSTLSIGEVAQQAGISTSAIRYYEDVGLLEEPERVGGKRRYDPGVIRWLALIETSKRAGLTIKEVHTLLYGFPAGDVASERWQSLASNKLEEVEEYIGQLQRMKSLLEEALRCDCASLDECARLVLQL